jgi:hypothetical protein
MLVWIQLTLPFILFYKRALCPYEKEEISTDQRLADWQFANDLTFMNPAAMKMPETTWANPCHIFMH